MKEVLMDTIARLDKEIEETRKRLTDLETARATLLSLGLGGQTASRPSVVESFRKARVPAAAPKTGRKKTGKSKKAVPAPKPAPAPAKKPARASGLKGAAAFKSFSVGAQASVEPTIKDKIIKTLGDGTPRTSAEIFEANGDEDRKASYWSTLTTMTKKKQVVKSGDNRYALPPAPAEDQAATAH